MSQLLLVSDHRLFIYLMRDLATLCFRIPDLFSSPKFYVLPNLVGELVEVTELHLVLEDSVKFQVSGSKHLELSAHGVLEACIVSVKS